MRGLFKVTVAAIAIVALQTPVEARTRHRYHHVSKHYTHHHKHFRRETYFDRFSDGIGPRPHQWCGWWMQHRTGITSRHSGLNLNLAAMWRYVGTKGHGSNGDIFVERHHVSMIVGPGRRPGTVDTISGNVRGGVRHLERPLSRAIAIRTPHGGSHFAMGLD